jgi:hypothetical protein
MAPPADHVDADDPEVGDALRRSVDHAVRHGARIERGVVIVERDHDLWIEHRGEPTAGQAALSVPRALLVGTDGLEWRPGRLELSGAGALSEPAASALELLLEVYDRCDKLERYRRTSPKVAATSDPRLAAAIAATRPSGPHEGSRDAASLFLASRTLAVRRVDPAAGPAAGDDGAARRDGARGSEPTLMPLIDAFNHDPEGDRYQMGAHRLAVSAVRPTGTAECFVDYGLRRDPVDLALHHGFTSARSRTANSAPVTVDLGDGRSVRITGGRRTRGGAPVVRATAESITLSGLTFDAGRPGLARNHLQLAVSSWLLQRGGSPEQSRTTAAQALEATVEANLLLLDELRAAAAEQTVEVRNLLFAATDLQVANLRAGLG